MSLFRLNLMMAVLLGALLLSLFGSTNGDVPIATGTMTTESFNGFTIDGVRCHVQIHDELIFYAEKGTTASTWYCKKIDSLQCRSGGIEVYDKMLELDQSMGEWHSQTFKQEIAVFYPTEVPEHDRWSHIDTFQFNYAVHSLFSTAQHPKILITIELELVPDEININIIFGPGQLPEKKRIFFQYQVIFEDAENLCRGASANPQQMLNYNLYANRKANKHSYYFIKNGNKICVYTLKHEDLFHVRQKTDTTAPTIRPVKFTFIKTFPTEYYAPNFYCVDPLYGTFVALYWDKQSEHLPEAHYYLIDEKNLRNFYLIDRNSLPGFDEAVLKAIFNGEFDPLWNPMFQSYGRQIFVWFKLRNENRAFHGLWYDKRYYKTAFENVDGVLGKQTTWHGRKDYIKYGTPVGRFDASELPPRVPLVVTETPPVAPQGPTTLSSPTTSEATTKRTVLPPTAAPSTSPPSATTSTGAPSMPPSSAAPPGTMQSSTPSPSTTVEKATSDSSNTTSNDSNFNQTTSSTVTESNVRKARPLESKGDGNKSVECDNGDFYLYLLIVLIVIIIFEVIFLVILIIIKSRGARKMKKAMARKKFSKSKTSIKKKKPSREGKKKKGTWTKESKKTTTENTAGSKTEDAATGKTADEKTTRKSADYYTVDEKFNKSSKKKNKK